MRKLLNTLYVTRAETYLRREGMDVVVSVEQKDIFRIPIINLDGGFWVYGGESWANEAMRG